MSSFDEFGMENGEKNCIQGPTLFGNSITRLLASSIIVRTMEFSWGDVGFWEFAEDFDDVFSIGMVFVGDNGIVLNADGWWLIGDIAVVVLEQ